jgi:hypothetical protein
MSEEAKLRAPGDALQFDAAVDARAGAGAPAICALCGTALNLHYFESAGALVCPSCKRAMEERQNAGSPASRFARAALFGLLGAIAGAALYYTIRAVTGYEIGLIAIVVGYLVGAGVHTGSRGRGGRRYQALAVAFTYLAIGSTYLPLIFAELKKGPPPAVEADSAKSRALASATPVPGEAAAASRDSGMLQSTSPDTPARGDEPGWLSPVGMLLGVGALLAMAALMPILAGFSELPSSLISLLILGFALQQAWRMNRAVRVTFTGPYKLGVDMPPLPSGG